MEQSTISQQRLSTDEDVYVTTVSEVVNTWSDISSTDIVVVVCAGFVMLVSLAGNISVLTAVGSVPSLQRINNVFIISLAVSDSLRAIACLPMFMTIQLDRGAWDNSVMCSAYHGVKISLDTASLLHVVFISLERSFIIGSPLIYQRIVNSTKMSICLAGVWLISVAYGLTQMIWIFMSDADQFQYCYIEIALGFIIFDFIFRFVFPLVCLLVSNCKICQVVQGHMLKIQPIASFTSVSQITQTLPKANSSHVELHTAADKIPYTKTKSAHNCTENNSHSSADMSSCSSGISSIGDCLTHVKDCGSNTHDIPGYGSSQHTNAPGDSPARNASAINVRDSETGEIIAPDHVSNSPQRSPRDQHDINPIQAEFHDIGSASSPNIIDTSRNATFNRSQSLPQLSGYQSLSILRRPSIEPHLEPYRKKSSVTFHIGPHDLAELTKCTTKQRSQPQNTICESVDVDEMDRSGSVCGDSGPVSDESVSVVNKSEPVQVNTSVIDPGNNQIRNVHPLQSECDVQSSSSQPPQTSFQLINNQRPRSGRRRSSLALQNRAAKLALALALTFLSCYLPFEVCHFIHAMCHDCLGLYALNITTVIAFSSSLLNPIVYNFYSTEFRKATKEACLCFNKRIKG